MQKNSKQPEIHLIAAQTRNRVIGRDGGMPWHLPRDLAHFKAATLGHPVIMGRRTYESLGKALPGRKNIVISRNPTLHCPDAAVCSGLPQALRLCADCDKVFIIGGGALYAAALPLADELNITWIETELPGDTFFPPLAADTWQEVSRQSFPADAHTPYPLQFVRYRRRP